MYKILNIDNMTFETDQKFNLIYADMIYEDNINLSWIDKYWNMLSDVGIFVVQTDWHSVFEVGYHLKQIPNSIHLNHICWKNEFGNFPKNKFRQSHDDILIFTNSKYYKFYPDRVQVEKATAKSKGLNKSGRLTKLATSVWTDICLTTVAKERIKNGNHNIRWQKPIALADRICLPFTNEGDYILDIYMESGTLGEWAKLNNRNYIGIEFDKNVFNIAKKRIDEK